MLRHWIATCFALLATGFALAWGSSSPYTRDLNATTHAVSVASAPNTAVTATLPTGGAATFHYITSIQMTRACGTAILGSATLTATSGNMPGSMAFTMGDACPIGSTNQDIRFEPISPIRSSVANTDTTFTCPALGIGGVCRINVLYFLGP